MRTELTVDRQTEDGRAMRKQTRTASVALRMLVCCAVVGSLSACSSLPSLPVFGGSKKVSTESPPDQIYGRADQLLAERSYSKAATRFEEVDRQHPYSPYARRAIVMSAYSYYKAGKYNEAIGAAKRYTTLHPGTKEAAMAYHIIASSYFDQMQDAQRDQTKTKLALQALRTLVRRYPESKYTPQARNRIRIAEDTLAAKEMTVGRYYLKNKNFLAAINRFRTVVTDYQTTPQVEEALMRLTEAYLALGIKAEAQTAAAVLGHNYPNSPWYKDAHTLLASDGLAPRNVGGSWLSRLWNGARRSVRL